QTNFVLTRPPETGPSAKIIYETLKEYGIMIRYFGESGLDDKLRISVGTPSQNERLLHAMLSS
ncbi:MAG: histidinol-phosphate transaminase, partial [Cyanobacteria bacterium J06576_12]